MLTCEELTELVTEHMEGRLPLLQRARFSIHTAICRNCRKYLRQMKMTVRTLGKLPDDPMPPQVREALIAQFDDWRR